MVIINVEFLFKDYLRSTTVLTIHIVSKLLTIVRKIVIKIFFLQNFCVSHVKTGTFEATQ